MSEKSKTPRTDSVAFYIKDVGYVVPASFAHNLEIDLDWTKRALFKKLELEVEINHLDRPQTYYPDCGHAEELAEAKRELEVAIALASEPVRIASDKIRNLDQWKAVAERLADAGSRLLGDIDCSPPGWHKALADFDALREEGES